VKKEKILLSFSSSYAAYFLSLILEASFTMGYGGMSKGLWLLISDLA
jgi:hypothetical protein